jgi:hypothetical protein
MSYNPSQDHQRLLTHHSALDDTHLEALHLIWVPPHHDQMHRPYTATGDVDAFYDCTEGGLRLSPLDMARTASRFLQPSVQPGAPVLINNGFQHTRYAFFLILVSPLFGIEAGSERVEVITGYTSSDEHDGGIAKSHWNSDNVNISPQLRYFVNDRVSFTRQISVGAYARTHIRLDPPSLLIHNGGVLNNRLVTARPEDVCFHEETRYARQVTDASDRRVVHIDTRNEALGTNVAASDLVTAYVRAADPNDSDGLLYHDYDQRVARALGHLQLNGGVGKSISDSMYYHTVCSNAPHKSSTFTHQDLIHRFGSALIDRTPVHMRTRDALEPMEKQAWHGSNLETSIAYQMTHVMPYILMQQLITELHVIITNRNMTGTPEISMVRPQQLSPGFLNVQRMEWVEGQIYAHVVQGILEATIGGGDYMVEMTFRLLTNSDITISINGDDPWSCSAPMFCSSVTSPQVSTDPSAVTEVASSIVSMAELVCSSNNPYSEKYSAQPTQLPSMPTTRQGYQSSVVPFIAPSRPNYPTEHDLNY